MNVKELYEKQYGQKKLVSINSFPRLRKVLKNFDIHRDDLALSLLDEGDKILLEDMQKIIDEYHLNGWGIGYLVTVEIITLFFKTVFGK